MQTPALNRHILDILTERGFVKQTTDADALRAKLSEGPVTFYIGFDPTADCLHVGHLLPILCMRWLQLAGHKPIVVQGGGTAMVGDPSGKDKTREILTAEQIEANIDAQKTLFGKFLDLDDAIVVNNAEWLLSLNYIAFLRDIGRHFSVNRMLGSSGAQQRLERGQGYSFIEFNYHLLQSYDFLELNRRYGCTLQCGGDDQWFNILGGVDLVRREGNDTAHAMTIPLLLTADGKKMGKTEKGAVWIDGERLKPYDYYQYWVNVHDDDVVRLLKLYTFLSMERIAELAALTGADVRTAKHVLAYETTMLAHGEAAAKAAASAVKTAFTGGASVDMPTFTTSFPVAVVDVLVGSELAKSKGAARRLIKGGGVRIGTVKVGDVAAVLEAGEVVWAGKKRCVRVVEG
ncbi:MAG: tyrosyl-tRNA synthetase [Myxococcota bacterium]|jgi:tyrosyl-tRNA synthetase